MDIQKAAGYPRPDMRRPFRRLDGTWQFAFDDKDRGMREKWYRKGYELDRTIQVPYVYQCRESGIGPTDEIHPIIWYKYLIDMPRMLPGEHLILHFGAVDDVARVFVNGQMVTEHTGGYAPFEVDITPWLRGSKTEICLRVEDRPCRTRPRGKQYWKRGLMGCWYTPSSGIWQSVWLESTAYNRILSVHFTPDVPNGRCGMDVTLAKAPEEWTSLTVHVTCGGEGATSVKVDIRERITHVTLDLRQEGYVHLWSPEHPELYDVEMELMMYGRSPAEYDRVQTYFGMREVEVRNGLIRLNGSRTYLRMILDQGYWPDTLLTPPSGDALKEDLLWTKKFGYNAVRKHQKMEDPRFYFWADVLGVMVWGEVPSAYQFERETVTALSDTLRDFILRDYNHPSIIAWVPLNESWGVGEITERSDEQHASRMLFHLCKALDPTRLVSGNDGWEQCETDICALHDYADRGEDMERHFSDREATEREGCDVRQAYVPGFHSGKDTAFMVTEYGGIAFSSIGLQGDAGGMESWGYHDKVQNEEEFFERYRSVTDAIRSLPYCQGYCYTQLTDVMQEINGLLTPDRKPKVSPERVAEINRNPEGR
ncbi:MAG: glycoside hydrolase family 2 [Clostridia bacterium]|nr:glycoside hydrolase family 2 [Clostridia bacterium]